MNTKPGPINKEQLMYKMYKQITDNMYKLIPSFLRVFCGHEYYHGAIDALF